MYIYTCIYMCVCIYIYIYACTYIYIYMLSAGEVDTGARRAPMRPLRKRDHLTSRHA